MSGSTTTTQQQQSQTQPWAPAIPMLNNILGQIGSVPLNASAGQTAAAGQIVGEASGTPSYAPQGEAAVSNLFGSSTTPQQNMLTSAYNPSAAALQPMLNSNYMNPATNPYLGPAMSTLNSDISNQIEGQFAAAGRPMGTNADASQAVARGVSQGEAGLLTNEYNTLAGQTMGAASELPQIAAGTSGAITGQQQVPLENQLQGMQASSAIPGMLTQPGLANMSAAQIQEMLPYMNAAQLEQLTVPIAGLGAQSQGTSTTSQQTPAINNILGGALGGIGLLGGTGAFGSAGWLAPLMASDERVKDDIQEVGMLYDETPVYSYRYKGDARQQIGVMAQDVEKRRPDAVHEIGGVKFVDYRKATERARMIGMLADMDMAA